MNLYVVHLDRLIEPYGRIHVAVNIRREYADRIPPPSRSGGKCVH
jgi:hypothetical protein